MSLYKLGLWDGIYSFAALWIVFQLLRYATGISPRIQTTLLAGPKSKNILFGLDHSIESSEDPGAVYERWATEYGPAFKVPGAFGSSKIVIVDPKANAHFYAKETFVYVQTKFTRMFLKNLVSGLNIV